MTRAVSPLLALALTLAACKSEAPPAAPPPPAPPAPDAKIADAQAAPAKVADDAPAAPAKVAPVEPPAPPLLDTPAIAAHLDAEQVVGFVGAEGLDQLAGHLLGFLDALGAAQAVPPDAPAEIFDPKKRAAALGFDPTTTAGWASVGLDAAAGVALVADRRLTVGEAPAPIVWLKIADRPKLLGALERHVGKVAEADGGATLTVGGQTVLVQAGPGGWTLALPVPAGADAAALRPGLAQAATPPKASLAEAENVAAALRLGRGPRAFGFLAAAPLLALAREEVPPEVRAGLDWTVAQVPAAGFAVGPGRGGVRVQVEAAARAALARVVRAPGPAVPLARHVPGDQVAGRYSLNPSDFMDGVADLVPPSLGAQRGQVLLAKNALPPLLGISYEDLAAALTGQVVVAVAPPVDGGRPIPTVLLGVNEAARADAVLKQLLDRAVKRDPGARLEPVEVASHKGFRVEALELTVVRAGKVLVGAFGPTNDAARFVAPEPNLAAAAPSLDEDVVFGGAVGPAFFAALPKPEPAGRALDVVWKRLMGDGLLHTAMRLDARGLFLGGEGSAGTAAAGLVLVTAAIAIPAFVKYVKRSKAAQARLTLTRLAQAVELHRLQTGALPAAAPLTPARSACPDGDGRYTPRAEDWAHPTWQALKAMPEGTFYHRLSFQPAAGGQDFTLTAVGDLDCDGAVSTFTWSSADGGALSVSDELE
jgi:type II secretory pathway pseudopilin PulG